MSDLPQPRRGYLRRTGAGGGVWSLTSPECTSLPTVTVGHRSRCEHLWVPNTFMNVFPLSPDGVEVTFICFFWELGEGLRKYTEYESHSFYWNNLFCGMGWRHRMSAHKSFRPCFSPIRGSTEGRWPQAPGCWGSPASPGARKVAGFPRGRVWLRAGHAEQLMRAHTPVRHLSLRWPSCLSIFWPQDLIALPTSQLPPQSPLRIEQHLWGPKDTFFTPLPCSDRTLLPSLLTPSSAAWMELCLGWRCLLIFRFAFHPKPTLCTSHVECYEADGHENVYFFSPSTLGKAELYVSVCTERRRAVGVGVKSSQSILVGVGMCGDVIRFLLKADPRYHTP